MTEIQAIFDYLQFLMSEAQDKRYVSLPYSITYGTLDDLKTHYGAMTARVGLFKAIFQDGADLIAGCNKNLTTVSVKQHTRRRKVGDSPKTINSHNYVTEIYPRKNVSFGKGGEEYKILIDGSWWGFRVSGKQSTFHSMICDSKTKLLIDVHYKTQSGASYYVNRKEGSDQ